MIPAREEMAEMLETTLSAPPLIGNPVQEFMLRTCARKGRSPIMNATEYPNVL
jgi:hypothetical protein